MSYLNMGPDKDELLEYGARPRWVTWVWYQLKMSYLRMVPAKDELQYLSMVPDKDELPEYGAS